MKTPSRRIGLSSYSYIITLFWFISLLFSPNFVFAAGGYCLWGLTNAASPAEEIRCQGHVDRDQSPNGFTAGDCDSDQVLNLFQAYLLNDKPYESLDLCKNQLEGVKKSGYCLYGKTCISGFINSEKCIGQQTRFPTLKACLTQTETNTLETKNYTDIIKDLKPPQLSVRIPTVEFSDVQRTLDDNGNISVPWIGEYISAIYKYAMGLGSIIAVILIVQQGITIVISGGGEMKTEAYQKIGKIFLGLGILWGSYAILYTVNPDLVNFKILKIKFIEKIPIPEEADSINPDEYPKPSANQSVATVEKPTWGLESFDCDKASSYTPMGVVPKDKLISYTCNGQINATTVAEMEIPLCKVVENAKKMGYTIKVMSSFRDFQGQVNNWCGKCKAGYPDPKQRVSFCAVPGYSNHGHGRAVDVSLLKNGKTLTEIGSKAQCSVNPEYIAILAKLFYDTDPNFNRLETEIWHFEYKTGGQNGRSKITTGSTKCK